MRAEGWKARRRKQDDATRRRTKEVATAADGGRRDASDCWELRWERHDVTLDVTDAVTEAEVRDGTHGSRVR